MALKWTKVRGKIVVFCSLLLAVLLYLMMTSVAISRPKPPAVPQNVVPIDLVSETLTSPGCHSSVYMVVLVGSHPDHWEVRDAIRHTWGNPRLDKFPFKLVFLFGQPAQLNTRRALAAESANHGDIIQGDFLDSYHNITARDLMGMRWAARHCAAARFVMHADDDVALDIYTLLDVLQQRRFNEETTDFMACFYVTRNASVERSGRYGMHRLDYPADVYPDFCHGWMYVLTPRLARRLVDASQTLVPPFWINDVYITGTLTRVLRVPVVDLEVRYALPWNLPNEVASGRSIMCDGQPYVVLPTQAQAWLTRSLQHLFLEQARTFQLPRHEYPVTLTVAATANVTPDYKYNTAGGL